MTGTTDAINDAEARTLAQRVWVRLEGVVERAVDTIKKLQDFVSNKMNTPESGTDLEESRAKAPRVNPAGGSIQAGSHGVNGQAAPGGALVMQVETMGKGVQAVLIFGVLLAILLAGMGWQSAVTERDRALSAEQAALAREANERTRHEQAEAELRAQLKETNTEARMAEYYILELDGKLMAGGFIPPSRGYGQWKQERKK